MTPDSPIGSTSKRATKKRRLKKPGANQRLACLRIPLFPLAARLRAEPELKYEGLAIFEGNGNAARVVAATRLARDTGIRPGQTLAQARSLLPRIVARARDPECERSAQDALLDAADRISPRVEDGNEGLVYIDISGLERHYEPRTADSRSPEKELALDLLNALDHLSLPTRIGIASSKLAAYIAAGLPGTPRIVDPGAEALFLAPLPVHRLAPESEVAETLKLWGIETVGQFAQLSKAEVRSRLGELGGSLHKAARGIDPNPLVARPPSPLFREGMSLEWPLTNLEPFLFIARTALERICQRLEARGLGCLKLELSMQLDPDGFFERAIELPSPTREVKTLLTLVRLDLEAHPPGAAVIGFHFLAHPDAPKLAQLSLLGPAALSPDKLATTIARLFALLGPGRVGSPRKVSGHRPERYQLVEYTPPPPPKIRPECRQGRGLLAVRVLRPPVHIEVSTNRPPERPTQTAATAESASASKAESLEKEDLSEEESGALTLDRQNGLFRKGLHERPRPISIQSLLPPEGDSIPRRRKKRPERKPPRIQGKVRIASGPWELEEQWWSDDPTERDYWDIELSDGSLYRIYHDRSSDQWFADGIYD